MRFDLLKCFIISQVMVGHRVCTVGSEEAVMVWWLLTDRCWADGG